MANRTYTVFLAEENDECVDKEVDIECQNIDFVLPCFYLKKLRHKRVTDIREKLNKLP
jgi:hypothetical protein